MPLLHGFSSIFAYLARVLGINQTMQGFSQHLSNIIAICAQETLEVPKLTSCPSRFAHGEEKNPSAQINILEEELMLDSPLHRLSRRSLPPCRPPRRSFLVLSALHAPVSPGTRRPPCSSRFFSVHVFDFFCSFFQFFLFNFSIYVFCFGRNTLTRDSSVPIKKLFEGGGIIPVVHLKGLERSK